MENFANNSNAIEEILNGNNSELELDDDDEEGFDLPTFYYGSNDDTFLHQSIDDDDDVHIHPSSSNQPEEIIANGNENQDLNFNIPNENGNQDPDVNIPDRQSAGQSNSISSKILTAALVWKKQPAFRNKLTHLDQVQGNLDSNVGFAHEYFNKYFTEKLYEEAAQYTNQFYLQENGRVLSPPATAPEIKIFFGINAFMGCLRYPQIHMYWSQKYGQKEIISKMSRDRFYCLRTNLHFVDNLSVSQEVKNSTKLWKVDPVLNAVRNRCLQIERSVAFYSVDEQMIPFSGRCNLKQLVKNKPRPVGLKNFVMTTSTGLMLDFEIYQGELTKFSNKSLGVGAAVILRLTETVPKKSSVYFDRYFTSIPLLLELKTLGIFGTGTLNTNRFKKATVMKSDRSMKRGDSEELIGSANGKKLIVITKWKDNKAVYLASTCSGKIPETSVSRWDKTSRSYKDVQCPNVVQMYNGKMGGVDLLDQSMEYYRTFFRTRKWTVKVILHFFDLAIVNSWQEYRRDCEANGIPKNRVKKLLAFRMEVGEYLREGCPTEPECSDDEEVMDTSDRSRNRPKPLPCFGKRFDNFKHFPKVDNILSPRRCSNCSGRTKTKCVKCDIYLCLAKDKNCFTTFHTY